MQDESKQFIVFLSIVAVAILVFSFILFGLTGTRVAFGIFFAALPFYLILNNFELGQGEKIVFSLLLGLTIFSSLVYILGFFISFKVSIFIIFALLIAIAYTIRYRIKLRKL